jgi:type I restriction enzyme R subunit
LKAVDKYGASQQSRSWQIGNPPHFKWTFAMKSEGPFRRRRLPHLDVPDAIYFVTACLNGSIPAQGLADVKRYRNELSQKPRPGNVTGHEWEIRKNKLLFARTDEWLDRQPAARHLEKPAIAKIVADSIKHFAGKRYDVWSFVIMPSHFHWIFRARKEWLAVLGGEVKKRSVLERVMHTLKLHTAIECNKALGTEKAFWQDESYDHCVRDDDELMRIIDYIELNPVRAGLVAAPELWLHSSAADRRSQKLAPTASLLY